MKCVEANDGKFSNALFSRQKPPFLQWHSYGADSVHARLLLNLQCFKLGEHRCVYFCSLTLKFMPVS